MFIFKRAASFAAVTIALATVSPASASLSVFQSYVGEYGLSTDGGGSTDSSYNINAFVPLGAIVTAAYLYQSNTNVGSATAISLNGNSLTFSPLVSYASLSSARADVTSLVASVVNGGLGGTYSFTVFEGNSNATDGTALAVIYQLAGLGTSTVALLDGFASTSGDSTTLNFAAPLNPAAPGFVADMRLGIGFSCCNQASTVSVNGTTISNTAGNYDDGDQLSNGSLITVGGDDDAYSAFLPNYGDDHERYDLTSYITAGDTAITIGTANPSGDDNIFLAAFRVTGSAGVNAPPPSDVPEPASWAMMLGGFGLIGSAMRRRRSATAHA